MDKILRLIYLIQEIKAFVTKIILLSRFGSVITGLRRFGFMSGILCILY